MAVVWYILEVLLVLTVASASDGPVVTTTLGKVQGTTLSIADHETKAYGFFNIPYAAPPVGDLRFQPPQPAASWEGVRQATSPGPPCPQNLQFTREVLSQFFQLNIPESLPYSEDCLHLSVYTPGLTGRRPIMVFIHGGGLWNGMADGLDMRVHAIREDIVGVVIQYRLGALGSWSVSMHLLSPLSKGLFHHGIMESGSIQDLFFFSPPVDVAQKAHKFADLLGCPKNSEELKQCLQRKSVEDILEPEGEFKVDMVDMIFVPRVDGECFPDHPSELLAAGNFNSEVDVIVGVADVEGFTYGNIASPGFAFNDNFGVEDFKNGVTELMKTVYPDSPQHWEALGEAAVEVCESTSDSDAFKRCFAEFAGDHITTSFKTARALAAESKGRIYFYELKHRREHSKYPDYIVADHGDDIFFLFGSSYTNTLLGATAPDFNTDDKIVEGLILKYFSSFARTGDPNVEGSPKWPELKENNSYLVINTNPSIEQNYKPRRMKYWMETAPDIVKGKVNGHSEL